MDETAKQRGEEINLDDEIEKAERKEGKTKFISEEKALQEIEGFLDKGVNDPAVLQGLAGLDSKEAWDLRYKYIENRTANIGFFAEGLAGVDSPAAINERQNILAMSGAHDSQIAQSLAGLDSREAWDLREKLFKKVTEDEYLAEGLAGVDSKQAWDLRKKLLDKGVSGDFLAKSLVGVDSKQAWDLREKFLQEAVSPEAHDPALHESVIKSLAGLDSARAWELRNEFIKKFGYQKCLATSLAGLDSKEAWFLRGQLVQHGMVNDSLESLAGLDSQIAWSAREEFRSKGADIDSLVLSINGNHTSAIAWRKCQERQNVPDAEVAEIAEGDLLILDNIVFSTSTKNGKTEYKSSALDRKLVILSSESEIPEVGRPYKVQVIEDTQPDNPKKGKLIAKLYFESRETKATDLAERINEMQAKLNEKDIQDQTPEELDEIAKLYKELGKMYGEPAEVEEIVEVVESPLLEQYERRVEILKNVGIIKTLSLGELGVVGVDSQDARKTKEYPQPHRIEIAKRIEQHQELLEKKKAQGMGTLLPVPFGAKLEDLIDVYQDLIVQHYQAGTLFATKKNLHDNNEPLVPLALKKDNQGNLMPLYLWGDYKNADIAGKLVYHPQEFSENHRGKTKQQILAQQEIRGETAGWYISVVEDEANIPRQGSGKTIGSRVQIDTKGSGIKKYIEQGRTTPSPQEYLTALTNESQIPDGMYEGETGMTPEEQLIRAIIYLEEHNQIIDDYKGNGSISYQIGAYFPASGFVPGAYWRRDRSQAYMGGDYPQSRDDYCGVRLSVRI